MAVEGLLRPTIHVEVLVREKGLTRQIHQEIRDVVRQRLQEHYVAVQLGQRVDEFKGMMHEEHVVNFEIADYTGPESSFDIHTLQDVQLDVQTYVLNDVQRHLPAQHITEEATGQTRHFALPNAALHDEWSSLVFDGALPARILRYLVRMMSLLGQHGTNLKTFNWNRLVLLHGPPGCGKSTLCRALAQKLSIRTSATFPESVLVEINANAMLSKYFGESGKQISATFDGIFGMAQDGKRLICVVIDEIETIAGSREKFASSNDCHDGLRATNQLLTALDRLRWLSNVLVLCTSNLITAIDPAFLDRVDIKQFIPSPSPEAIYSIFQSCLNELVKSNLIERATPQLALSPTMQIEQWDLLSHYMIPAFCTMVLFETSHPESPGSRVWALAQKCHGFSGRTLRRLPVLGMAMYTWGGECSLQDAVSALEAAVDQELLAMKGK